MATFGTSKKITLDLCRNKYVSTRVAQYDINSREIIIQITDDGKPYHVDPSQVSVRIKYLKSDRNPVVDDIPSENILSDGTIKLILSEQMCASYGRNEAELLLIDTTSSKAIHTMHFVVVVEKSSVDNDVVTSTQEYKSFENALVRLEYILENLKPITKSQIDALF